MDPNALKNIEDLHRLKNEGIISEEEFERSKAKILFGPASTVIEPANPRRQYQPGVPPDRDDHFGWATLPLRRYAEFEGRSGRREFWMFQLIYVALGIAAALLTAIGGPLGIAILILGLLAMVVPLLAVQARRFHNQNRSGWLTLINLIPYAGVVIVFIFMLLPGTEGGNRYGPDPSRA